MRKVLILTAAYGEGHNAAARGLQEAFQLRGDTEVLLLDPFVDAYGAFYQRSRHDYLRMIDQAPRVWSSIYGLLDRTPLIHALAAVQPALKRRIERALHDFEPEAVVSVYPLFPYFVNAIFPPEKERPFRLYTVVTDSITINSAWHRSPSDLYFVPNHDSAAVMSMAGVPADQLEVLGFPVPPRFATARPERPAPEIGGARVLFMINAGRQRAPEIVREIMKDPALRLTVTVGKDEELRARVEQVIQETHRQADVLGWIPNMPELLMTHHVLIGKAGGAAVQEAIAACTPMLITHVVPGQEEGNARLLMQNGCGAVRESPAAIASELGALFAEGARRWHELERQICRLSRPDAAIQIAERMLADSAAESTVR